MSAPLVPDEFDVPLAFRGPGFRLEPLGPEHNERDHEAWMSSIDHIKATPGFENWDWPEPMSLAENLGDLEGHARDFIERRGFTYSVLDGDAVIDEVLESIAVQIRRVVEQVARRAVEQPIDIFS